MELPPAIAERLGFLLGKNHYNLTRRVEHVLPPGFTPKHFGCLAVVASEGPLSQQRLGERMGLDRTTIVAIVDALEKAGYVKRRRDPADRRAYALEVTKAGTEWLAHVRAVVLGAEKDFLSPLSATERRTLVALLQKLLTAEP